MGMQRVPRKFSEKFLSLIGYLKKLTAGDRDTGDHGNWRWQNKIQNKNQERMPVRYLAQVFFNNK